MADVLLGHDKDTGKNVYLTEEGRQLSTYIIGTIGTGKSTLLEQIAIQDMQNGDGLCFLDPHEEAAERLLRHVPNDRKDDVIYWDPADRTSPFGLNPFFCLDEEEVDTKADNFLAALGSLAEFAETFEAAPRMKDVMLHMAIAFIVNQGKTLAETPLFLTNETYRKLFYPALDSRYPQVRYYWEEFDHKSDRGREEQVGSTLNKVRRFQANNTLRNIFGQPTNAIDFREAMDERKIIIVKLNSQRLGVDNAAFIGAFIVWEIFQAALSRADTPEEYRPQFHLLADEFQTYMTTAFPSLIEQVRKFNVDVTVAHQRRDQIPVSSRNAPLVAGNKVVFTVIGHDAHELAKEFRIVIPEPEVASQQPKHSIVPNALEHLSVHGHIDTKVMEEYRRLMQNIDDLYHALLGILSGREVQQIRYNQTASSRIFPFPSSEMVTSTTHRELEQSKQRVMGIIDRLLYLVMTGPDDEFYKDFTDSMRIPYFVSMSIPGAVDLPPHRVFHEKGWTAFRALENDLEAELVSICLSSVGSVKDLRRNMIDFLLHAKDRDMTVARIYHDGTKRAIEAGWSPEEVQEDKELMEQAENLAGRLPDNPDANYFVSRSQKRGGSPEEWELSWIIVHLQYIIPDNCIELSRYLRKKPIFVPTGQYDPVLEKPRLYSDVEAEIANTLATLPRFTARCKLLQDGHANEYTIETFDRPKPGSGAESTAEEIKWNSRHLYGRDRTEVEQEIATRLRTTPAPAPRPEPPAQPEQESLDLWEEEE